MKIETKDPRRGRWRHHKKMTERLNVACLPEEKQRWLALADERKQEFSALVRELLDRELRQQQQEGN